MTVGMDTSEAVVARVRASGHEAWLVSPAVWDRIPNASLDAVRLNHVLEHLYRPGEVMRLLHQKMKPGARCYVATPNPEGLSARWFGAAWRGLECPRHVVLYGPRTLRHWLQAWGFSSVRIYQERSTKDAARSLGFARGLEVTEAEAMKFDALLNEWLAPLCWMAGALGWGDRLHAFAVR